MSLYIVPAKQSYHQVLLGYTPAVESFYIHVVDTRDNLKIDPHTVWEGRGHKEITDPSALMRLADPYVNLTPERRAAILITLQAETGVYPEQRAT